MDEEVLLEVPGIIEHNDRASESAPELTVLMPVSYDTVQLPNPKPFDKMDIDNHNVQFDNSNQISLNSKTSVLHESSSRPFVDERTAVYTTEENQLDDSVVDNSTPSKITPGQSRYGRVRRPKLSADFVSVDRKSYAVLNSSSFNRTDVSELSRQESSLRKKEVYRKRNVQVNDENFSTDCDTKENRLGIVSIADDASCSPMKSVELSEIPKYSTGDIDSTDPVEFDDSSRSSLNLGNIKTYSRKNDVPNTSIISEEKHNLVEPIKRIGPQLNFTELKWKVGDVAWAKIGCYPYWPSIVTLEYGSSIYVKSVGKRMNRLAVHVQFFGDRGRRSWVLTTSLIKYESKEQFIQLKAVYKKQKDKIRLKYFFVPPRYADLWERAVTEADTILKLSHEERLQYYHTIYPVTPEMYAIEVANTNKIKRPPVRRKRNPLERRGRKRKVLSEADNFVIHKKKLLRKHILQEPDTLFNEDVQSQKPKKVRRPIDEHTKNRRAFMRRMNKILKQSSNSSTLIKKRMQKRTKKMDTKNDPFNKLLKNVKQRNTVGLTDAIDSNTNHNLNKKDLSIYDFESDEETDVFIGTYNSRFTPQILSKIEAKEDDLIIPPKKEHSQGQTESKIISRKHKIGDGKLDFMTSKRTKKILSATDSGSTFTVDNAEEIEKCEDDVLVEDEMSDSHRNGDEKSVQSTCTSKAASSSSQASTPNSSLVIVKRIRKPKRQKVRKIVDHADGSTYSKIRDSSEDKKNEEDSKKQPKKNEKLTSNFEDFRSKYLEKVTSQYSHLNNAAVEKLILKMWSDRETNQKSRNRSQCGILDNDLSSENDDEPKSEEDKRCSSSPLTVPASKMKKSLMKIYTGLKSEKVCQMCEKPGFTLRCRGPCSGNYHLECASKNIDVSSDGKQITPLRRRGRQPRLGVSSNLVNSVANVSIEDASNTENESRETTSRGTVDNMDSSDEKDDREKLIRESKSANDGIVNEMLPQDLAASDDCKIADNNDNTVTQAVGHQSVKLENEQVGDELISDSASKYLPTKTADECNVKSNIADDKLLINIADIRKYGTITIDVEKCKEFPNNRKTEANKEICEVFSEGKQSDKVDEINARENQKEKPSEKLFTSVKESKNVFAMMNGVKGTDIIANASQFIPRIEIPDLKESVIGKFVDENQSSNFTAFLSESNKKQTNNIQANRKDVLMTVTEGSCNDKNEKFADFAEKVTKTIDAYSIVGSDSPSTHKDRAAKMSGSQHVIETSKINDETMKNQLSIDESYIDFVNVNDELSVKETKSATDRVNCCEMTVSLCPLKSPINCTNLSAERTEDHSIAKMDLNVETPCGQPTMESSIDSVNPCIELKADRSAETRELSVCISPVTTRIEMETEKDVDSCNILHEKVENQGIVEQESLVINFSTESSENQSKVSGYSSNLSDVDSESKLLAPTQRTDYSNNVMEIRLPDKIEQIKNSVVENEETGSSDTSSDNQSNSTKASSSNGVDFRCARCIQNKMYPCFSCGKEIQEKTGETQRYNCYLVSCGRVYHKECLKSWPQASWGNGLGKETLRCPQHYCHTCISDNPAVLKNKQCNETLMKCIKCPTSYHKRIHCIPAGTEVLNTSQIICPRHYEPPPGMRHAHFNTSWCFICCIGGSLICCDECPTSFHAECLRLRPDEYEGRYICDDCQTGRYLLHGEIAWVKLGHYRWWPARILFPNEVPENIRNLPHRRGEFAVQFFGSHNFNWVNRGRAFLYQEGDSGQKTCRRSSVDLAFEKAMLEAEKAYKKLQVDKAARDEEAKVCLKPPRYVRIKANKPVGNVRIVEMNTSNITACECDPKSERPCAPDSDCLNRMLLVECNPLVCPAGDRCLNQAFEKRAYPPLVPYKTDNRGWGLKTLVDVKKGDFIIEYVGEMIDEEEYKRRVDIMHKNHEDNYYFLTIDKDRMLDAGPKGNVSRFMNHSCEPNCETQKWTVNGDTRVGLFALKSIPANTELVFNYNLVTKNNEMKPCYCGSDKCSGFIGVKAVKNGNSSTDDETRKRSNEEIRKRSLDDALGSSKKNLRMKSIRKMKGVRRKSAKGLRLSAVTTKRQALQRSTDLRLKRGAASVFKKQRPNDSQKSLGVRKRGRPRRIDLPIKKRARSFDKVMQVKTARGCFINKKIEALYKHREKLRNRVTQLSAGKTETPRPVRIPERRGRKKTPRNEQEKQEILFQTIKKRIERKFEFMSALCSVDETCFVCGIGGELLLCDNSKCPRGYHLQCVDKMKWPSGYWLCPWHYCNICQSKRQLTKCSYCISSFCLLHSKGNVFPKDGAYVCKKHRYAVPAPNSTNEDEKSATNDHPQTVVLSELPDDVESGQSSSPMLCVNSTETESSSTENADKSHSLVPSPLITDIDLTNEQKMNQKRNTSLTRKRGRLPGKRAGSVVSSTTKKHKSFTPPPESLVRNSRPDKKFRPVTVEQNSLTLNKNTMKPPAKRGRKPLNASVKSISKSSTLTGDKLIKRKVIGGKKRSIQGHQNSHNKLIECKRLIKKSSRTARKSVNGGLRISNVKSVAQAEKGSFKQPQKLKRDQNLQNTFTGKNELLNRQNTLNYKVGNYSSDIKDKDVLKQSSDRYVNNSRETSDDEYVNLEVEVINEDSN